MQQTTDLLKEVREHLTSVFATGAYVKHRSSGEGIVKERIGTVGIVFSQKFNDTKKLGLTIAFENRLISLEFEKITQKIKEYLPVLKQEQDIPKALTTAIEDLHQYMEYLN